MEKLAMKQYSNNIAKGKEIIEFFVAQLRDEGITSVPEWQPSKDLAGGDAVQEMAQKQEEKVSSHLDK